MIHSSRRPIITLALSLPGLLLATDAAAYMGPSLGLGIVGTVIAILLLALLSVFSFVYLPIRKLVRKSRQAKTSGDTDSDQ